MGTRKTSLDRKKILHEIETRRDELDRYGVRKIGLFGSFISGSQKRSSDLDFLVVLKEPSFDSYMDLKFLLERLFRRKVDLVLEDSLKPSMQYVKERAIYAKGF